MSKKLLREQVLAQLSELVDDERKQIEKKFYRTLFQSDIWKQAEIIGLTQSVFPEWNTRPIIERAWKEEKKVSSPKTLSKTRQMEFYVFQSFDKLKKTSWGIFEPIPEENQLIESNQIDLLIVPGVLFTNEGYRIGFGGGYYDRFLQSFKGETLSLCSENQMIEQFEIEQHDIPVKYLITEKGWLNCKEIRSDEVDE